MTPESVRKVLGREPSRTALLFDFDGTLAPIVADPATAELSVGAADLLDALAARFCRVGVVSGRPLDYLEARLPASLALSGLYGLESRIDGQHRSHPQAEEWRDVVATVAADPAVPAGLTVELKGASLTVHFRGRDDLADAAQRWAASAATSTGLLLRPAKASLELHPPIDVSKGTAVKNLANGCEAVCFVGDDVGDLPAFEALDELALDGVETVKVACGGPELPREVEAAVDLTVGGPGEIVTLFAPLTS